MSGLTAAAVTVCSAMVLIGALQWVAPAGAMEKPVKTLLGVVFLTVAIGTLLPAIGKIEPDFRFASPTAAKTEELDAASARYIAMVLLQNAGINFSEITVCTDKSDDGSIHITKITIFSDCEEETIRSALRAIAGNDEVVIIHESNHRENDRDHQIP